MMEKAITQNYTIDVIAWAAKDMEIEYHQALMRAELNRVSRLIELHKLYDATVPESERDWERFLREAIG